MLVVYKFVFHLTCARMPYTEAKLCLINQSLNTINEGWVSSTIMIVRTIGILPILSKNMFNYLTCMSKPTSQIPSRLASIIPHFFHRLYTCMKLVWTFAFTLIYSQQKHTPTLKLLTTTSTLIWLHLSSIMSFTQLMYYGQDLQPTCLATFDFLRQNFLYSQVSLTTIYNPKYI